MTQSSRLKILSGTNRCSMTFNFIILLMRKYVVILFETFFIIHIKLVEFDASCKTISNNFYHL